MFRSKDSVGKILKNLRLSKELTGQDLAKRLGVTQGFVSKIETGNIKPSIDLIEKYSLALQLPLHKKNELLELTQAFIFSFDRWSAGDTSYEQLQQTVSKRVKKAKVIEGFCLNIFPGFLQVKEYAKEIFLGGYKSEILAAKKEDLELGLKERLKQSKILLNKNSKITIIVSEAAIATRLGSRKTYCLQLEFLKEVIEKQLCDFRIIPFLQHYTYLPIGTFIIFDRKSVSVEAQNMCFNFLDPQEIDTYCKTLDYLRSLSLSGDGAIQLIDKYLNVA